MSNAPAPANPAPLYYLMPGTVVTIYQEVPGRYGPIAERFKVQGKGDGLTRSLGLKYHWPTAWDLSNIERWLGGPRSKVFENDDKLPELLSPQELTTPSGLTIPTTSLVSYQDVWHDSRAVPINYATQFLGTTPADLLCLSEQQAGHFEALKNQPGHHRPDWFPHESPNQEDY